MKFLRSSSLFLVVAISFTLLACQEPYHQKEEQFYFIAANINLPYWQQAQAGLLDAAKEMGVKAELDGPTSLSPQEEVDSFMKAVALHPAGIMVSVSHVDIFKGPIDAAVAQGIPVIAIDSDAPQSKRVLFVGTDNFRAGQESGRRMGTILKGQGSIVVVTIPGQLNLDERLRGVNDALQKSPASKSSRRWTTRAIRVWPMTAFPPF